MADKNNGDWQQRYEQSIEDETARIAEDDANESGWSRLIDRVTYTGTGLDLLLLPFVLVIFGIPALKRHLERRRQT